MQQEDSSATRNGGIVARIPFHGGRARVPARWPCAPYLALRHAQRRQRLPEIAVGVMGKSSLPWAYSLHPQLQTATGVNKRAQRALAASAGARMTSRRTIAIEAIVAYYRSPASDHFTKPTFSPSVKLFIQKHRWSTFSPAGDLLARSCSLNSHRHGVSG